MDPNLILTAITETEKIGEALAKKKDAADAVNVFTDRAQAFADLLDPKKHDDAYRTIYADIQVELAKKQISPTVYQQGDYTIAIPLATLKELMDCASR